MRENYKISIIIPVYNAIKYLPKCIESILSQTYGNLEVIFVDDASTDGSREYIEKFIDRFKQARLIKNETNIKPFLSRIKGFEQCTGDFVICLDGDDYVDSDYYEKLLNKIVETDADMCIGDTTMEGYQNIIDSPTFDFRTEYYEGGECLDYLLFSNENRNFSVWNKLVKRSVLNTALEDMKQYNNIENKISFSDDVITLLIVGYYVKKLVAMLGPCYHYVYHYEQSTNITDKDQLAFQLYSLKRGRNIALDFLEKKNLLAKYQDSIIRRFNKSFLKLKNNAYVNGYMKDPNIKKSFESTVVDLRNSNLYGNMKKVNIFKPFEKYKH